MKLNFDDDINLDKENLNSEDKNVEMNISDLADLFDTTDTISNLLNHENKDDNPKNIYILIK